MKGPLRHSQINHALRKLRYLSSQYLKQKTSATSEPSKLIQLATRIKSILAFLKVCATKKIIQHAMGAAFTIAGLFLHNDLEAQNFIPAVPITTQVESEGVIIPTLVDFDNDGDLDLIGLTYDYCPEEISPFFIENVGDASVFTIETIGLDVPEINLIE